MGKHSIIGPFFAWAKKTSAKGQSSPQELEVGPHSGPYLLVLSKMIATQVTQFSSLIEQEMSSRSSPKIRSVAENIYSKYLFKTFSWYIHQKVWPSTRANFQLLWRAWVFSHAFLCIFFLFMPFFVFSSQTSFYLTHIKFTKTPKLP